MAEYFAFSRLPSKGFPKKGQIRAASRLHSPCTLNLAALKHELKQTATGKAEMAGIASAFCFLFP
jgi:hypothetical protein